MMRPDGLVKVLDLGLAKSIDPPAAESALATLPQTTAGTIAGTVRYMSPEQTRGLPLDARSDVFSLGIVIYEMLCGRPPFQGETATDVMVAIVDRGSGRDLKALCRELNVNCLLQGTSTRLSSPATTTSTGRRSAP